MLPIYTYSVQSSPSTKEAIIDIDFLDSWAFARKSSLGRIIKYPLLMDQLRIIDTEATAENLDTRSFVTSGRTFELAADCWGQKK